MKSTSETIDSNDLVDHENRTIGIVAIERPQNVLADVERTSGALRRSPRWRCGLKPSL
ncbi:hypothetical protein [Roseiflexus castenholzii]|uniref:hypothetical protein n=1 Tax=Roseiflexus castenholzii TaxID=120962 RepID=UPI0023530E16